MGVEAEKARELIELAFTFDNVGDAMTAVRRDPSSQTVQERLVRKLVDHAARLAGDDSSESLLVLTKAARLAAETLLEMPRR